MGAHGCRESRLHRIDAEQDEEIGVSASFEETKEWGKVLGEDGTRSFELRSRMVGSSSMEVRRTFRFLHISPVRGKRESAFSSMGGEKEGGKGGEVNEER